MGLGLGRGGPALGGAPGAVRGAGPGRCCPTGPGAGEPGAASAMAEGSEKVPIARAGPEDVEQCLPPVSEGRDGTGGSR